MLVIGLTGGIGSGKSTVARMLAERGAVVLDADAFAREALDKDTPELGKVFERFGSEVVGAEGRLDRRALASIVFADERARRDLEAIVHPYVGKRIADGIAENSEGDSLIVLESPLLIEMGTNRICDVVIVVTASADTRVARLIARGISFYQAVRPAAAGCSPSSSIAISRSLNF